MTRPQDLIRPELLGLSAYHVPSSAGLIKLDAMENPYPWPGDLATEWGAALAEAASHRYPDPQGAAVRTALREVFAIPSASEILLGNGSDELIQMLALALAKPGAVLMAPEPSFVMYRLTATICGMRYVGVPLAKDFSLDVDALLAGIRREQPALIFIAQPNNPTGTLFDEAGLKQVLEAAPGLVVLDEAYFPFCDTDSLRWLERYPNLLVMRTLSKFGLAGLRLGFLCGEPRWLGEFDKTRLPYNINALTQAGTCFALKRQAIFADRAKAIRIERTRFADQLQQVQGVARVYPSAANFLLFRVAAGRASAVHQSLRAGGVLIKNLHGSHPALADCLRVTVGTPDENTIFLKVLAQVLATSANE